MNRKKGETRPNYIMVIGASVIGAAIGDLLMIQTCLLSFSTCIS